MVTLIVLFLIYKDRKCDSQVVYMLMFLSLIAALIGDYIIIDVILNGKSKI